MSYDDENSIFPHDVYRKLVGDKKGSDGQSIPRFFAALRTLSVETQIITVRDVLRESRHWRLIAMSPAYLDWLKANTRAINNDWRLTHRSN